MRTADDGSRSGRFSQSLAIALILFGIFLVTRPVAFQDRDIIPPGTGQVADFSHQQPLAIQPNVSFKIAVGGDVEILHHPLSFQELSDPEVLNTIDAVLAHKPHLVMSRLGFKLATHGSPPQCESLRIILNGTIPSRPLSCASIIDNEIAYFDFDRSIPPRIYDLTFAGNGASRISAYGFPAIDHTLWLPGFYTKADSTIGRMHWDWIRMHPWSGLMYLLGVGSTAYAFLRMKPSALAFVTLLAGLLASVLLIMPFYSGHDETAHLTMMQHGVLEGKDEVAFNTLARESMIDHDFYRLNGARLLVSGECPHHILFVESCGISTGPETLYRAYGTALKALGLQPDNTPRDMLILGRLFNAGLVILAGFLSWSFFGEGGILLLVFFLLLVGSFFGQVASISNDPPMFLLGFFLAMGAAHILRGNTRWMLPFLGASGLAFYWLKRVDRGYIAALPLLLSLALFYLLARMRKAAPRELSFRSGFLFYGSFLLLLALGIPFQRFATHLGFDLITMVGKLTADANFLININKFDFVGALKALIVYGQSAIGSFIWGHSLLPGDYAFSVALSLGALAWVGVGSVASRYTRSTGSAIIILLAALAAIQSLVILSAELANANDLPVIFESFLKPRLTAPGLGTFLIPAFLGLLSLWERPQWRLALLRILAFWAIAWQLYLLPYVSLKDLY